MSGEGRSPGAGMSSRRGGGVWSMGEAGGLASSSSSMSAGSLGGTGAGRLPSITRLEKKSERTQRFLAGLEGLRRITTDSSCGETRLSLSTASSGAATAEEDMEEDASGVMVESVTIDTT